ncbi:histidine utilization repressor [Pseudomonas boanensis]|nr:histidine utilization repressor [Pseudomonas boanensis]
MGETPAPLYARVKQMISQQIQSGTWPPHYRVPSESELVNELGFSRMTINRALRELTAEGLLVRMQGVGTFVAEPKGQAALFEVHNIAEEIAQRGHRHSCEVVSLTEEKAGPEHALALGVREGQRVFHSRIVHFENEVPVQIEDRFVNAAVAPDYLKQDFTQQTPYVYLSQVAPITEGEHVVEAILADAEECKLLHIERGQPCLLIRRRTWSGRNTVTSARLLYPGTRYRLEGRFGS